MERTLLGSTGVDFDAIDQPLSMCFCIRQILEGKNWKHTEAVHQIFVDYKKAHESVRKEVLYNILIEFGGFRRNRSATEHVFLHSSNT